jgi:hypothetical protein
MCSPVSIALTRIAKVQGSETCLPPGRQRPLNSSNEHFKLLHLVDVLDAATVFADSKKFQTAEYAYRHGMSNPNQSPKAAMYKADEFVRAQFIKQRPIKKRES